jgi:putative oxidoreductase
MHGDAEASNPSPLVNTSGGLMDMGLLIARVVFGMLMAAHGSQKLFGWFGGHGISGTATYFESLGFHPGRVFAIACAVTEAGSGLLLAFGLLQPLASAAIIAVMIVAIATVHWANGLLSTSDGVELPLLYIAATVGFALTGPGVYSLDALFGLTPLWTQPLKGLVLAGGVVGGFVSLAIRRSSPPAATHA